MSETRKTPGRWRWTKRVIAAYVILLGGSLAGHLWWRHAANERLQAAIDAVRQRGEPLTIDELRDPSLPRDENAAEAYERAAATPLLASPLSPPPAPPGMTGAEFARLRDMMLSDVMLDAALRRRYPEQLAQILALAEEPLALVREGNRRPGIDWSNSPGYPCFGVPVPSGTPSRHVAKLLATVALGRHETGNDAAAVEALREMQSFVDRCQTLPTLIGHLIANANQRLLNDAVEEIAPTLRVGDGPGAASREQVESLLADLLDEHAMRGGRVGAYLSERVVLHAAGVEMERDPGGFMTTVLQAAAPSLPGAAWTCIFQPAWRLDLARALEEQARYVEASRQPTYAQDASIRPPAQPEAPPINTILLRPDPRTALVRPFSATAADVARPAAWARMHYLTLAGRRMAAVALAMRLYEIDHGAQPDTLAALVPDYLPAIPQDPFGQLGETILYALQAEQPVLYSRNVDGADDGGTWVLAPAWVGSGMRVDDESSPDLVLFLDGDRPEPEPVWVEPSERNPWELGYIPPAAEGTDDGEGPPEPDTNAEPEPLFEPEPADAQPATTGSAPAPSTSAH